jgi:peptidoglycan/LPS O-acetylase OafA/YrhL
MRGVAAISVMMFHYLFGTSLHMFTQAYYAVDFFFCLSGVILAHSYENKIVNAMSFHQYMGRRLIRLYPFYLLGFLLGIVLLLSYMVVEPIIGFHSRDYILCIFFGAFFLPYPSHSALPFVGDRTIGGPLFPVNVPAWSLFFELLASVALFVVVRKRINLRYIICASFVMMVVAQWHYDTANIGWGTDTVLGGFPRTAFTFFIGVVIYRTHVKLRFLIIQMNPWMLLGITMAMFALPIGGSVRFITFIVLIPTVTYLGLAIKDDGKCRVIFNNIGRMSYGVYAIHWPIYHLVVVLLKHGPWARGVENAHIILAGIVGALVIVLAQLLTLFIDEPVRRWLSTRYSSVHT